jgi:carboxymethylenebutenolidase
MNFHDSFSLVALLGALPMLGAANSSADVKEEAGVSGAGAMVQIPVPDAPGPMAAYVASPSGAGPHPAVIVCMSVYGVNGDIRRICDRLAKLGYIAVAPDFFHRWSTDPSRGYDAASREQGMGFLKRITRDEAIADVDATLKYLKGREDVGAKIGIIGISIGGHIAYLAATQYDFRATVAFYGGWITNTDIPLSQPEPTLNLSAGIAKHGGRLLYLVGSEDRVISAAQIELLKQGLALAKVQAEVVVYPGVKHSYFCEDLPDYNAAASEDSWHRIERLLAEQLAQA